MCSMARPVAIPASQWEVQSRNDQKTLLPAQQPLYGIAVIRQVGPTESVQPNFPWD